MRHIKLYEAYAKRKHPVYAKLDKFFKQFPDDATSWRYATDELRDMARGAREIYTEMDLDMLTDEWEKNPDAPQPLDFDKLKTPAEWNSKSKAYILDTLDKMSDDAKDSFGREFKEWLK